MIRRYRKKPVVVEAFHYQGTKSNFDLMRWCVTIGGNRRIEFRDGTAIINTLEGDMRASPGDFIIRGVNNEIYPCKPDIFELTYEEVQP